MLTFVDMFCGGGFGAFGAVRAGAKPLLAVDAWDVAVKTYESNFPDAKVLCADVSSIDPRSLHLEHTPDVLLTSPECTSHSIARGAKPSCSESQNTAIQILPWLEHLKPNWLILENVRRMKKWGRHKELVSGIESVGYRVDEVYLDAANFGVPQSRKRLFLICNKLGVQIFEEQLTPKRRKIRSARDILDKGSRFNSNPLFTQTRARSTIERAKRGMAELGERVPFLIVYYGSDYAGGWQTLDAPLRTITTLDRFGLITWKNAEPFLRMLQPGELAKAMGAARIRLDHGTRRDKVKLCGNGVCSPVMEQIFKTISQVR